MTMTTGRVGDNHCSNCGRGLGDGDVCKWCNPKRPAVLTSGVQCIDRVGKDGKPRVRVKAPTRHIRTGDLWDAYGKCRR